MAQVPDLLNAVALAGGQHGLHRAPVVVIGRFLNKSPADTLAHGAHLKLRQVGVVLVEQRQVAGKGQKIDPVAEGVELVGAFVAAPPKGGKWSFG